MDKSQLDEDNLKQTNRSSSVCSTNSQFRNQVVQKISDTLKFKFNKEIVIPQNNHVQQKIFKDLNNPCDLQPIQEQIEDLLTAQSQADFLKDELKCNLQWQQIEGNYECGERLLTLNEQSTYKADLDVDKHTNREEPLILANNREHGCINYHDSKQQDKDIETILKKSIMLRSFHQKSQIDCLSQESSTSSYLQNPDKPSESVRNISQIVENTNNFMQILDLFTYYNQKDQQMYNTQPISNDQTKAQTYNSLDNRQSIYDQNQKNDEDCMKTIQTFTDDFVDDKNKTESNNLYKNQKKTVGIRVDELLNKFKKESNFDTMSKSKSKNKQIANIVNNHSTVPDTIEFLQDNEIEVLKVESNKDQDLINKKKNGKEECVIEVKNWIQQKYDSKGSPLQLKLALQEQIDKREINNFVSKSDRFTVQQLGSSEKIHFYQKSLKNQIKNLKVNYLKQKKQIKEQDSINLNSEREKRKNYYIKQNQKCLQNQQKNDQQQIQKFSILNKCILSQASKQQTKKQNKKVDNKLLKNQKENQKENIVNNNDEKRKVLSSLQQNRQKNQNKQKYNILSELQIKDCSNNQNVIDTQTTKKEIEENKNENKFNQLSSQKYQDTQRNQIISLLSDNSRQGDIIDLPFYLMQTNTLIQGQGQGGSTQISSERQFANEQNIMHSNLQNSFLQTVQIQKDVFQNQQENIQETILQSQRNIDINFQEINFKNDLNSTRELQSNRIEDRIRIIEEQNKQLQLHINQINISQNKKNLSIKINDSEDRKKIIENIGTQPITATNVLLSSDIKQQNFCFDYQDLNKQDDQFQIEFEEQLNLLSSQRLSYEIGCFEATSSYLNTQNFRTPRVIQMLSDRSNEGYLPDNGNEGLLSYLINDQSPLQIDYSNNSYQQNIINNINSNAYQSKQSKESQFSSNASLHQKQQNTKIYEYQQNHQKIINLSPRSNTQKINLIQNQQNDENRPVQQQNFIKSRVEETQLQKQTSQNTFKNEQSPLEQNVCSQDREQLNGDKSDKQVEIKKILQNIEILKKARANSGDRRSSQELKILTEQVIEKSLLQIQQIQGGVNKNI